MISNQDIDVRIEREINVAMRRMGWLIPTTVEEVRRAEAELEANPIEVPESLVDPMRLLAEIEADGGCVRIGSWLAGERVEFCDSGCTHRGRVVGAKVHRTSSGESAIGFLHVQIDGMKRVVQVRPATAKRLPSVAVEATS